PLAPPAGRSVSRRGRPPRRRARTDRARDAARGLGPPRRGLPAARPARLPARGRSLGALRRRRLATLARLRRGGRHRRARVPRGRSRLLRRPAGGARRRRRGGELVRSRPRGGARLPPSRDRILRADRAHAPTTGRDGAPPCVGRGGAGAPRGTWLARRLPRAGLLRGGARSARGARPRGLRAVGRDWRGPRGRGPGARPLIPTARLAGTVDY